MRKALPFIFLLAGLGLVLWRWQATLPGVKSETRLMMGTIIEIRVEDGGKEAEDVIGRAFGEIARVESMMDPHRSGSDLAKINAGFEMVRVNDDTRRVLDEALRIVDRSKGAFSPVLGGVVDLWDFDNEGRLPDPEVLAAALPPSPREGIRVANEGIQRISPKVKLDFGAIAKGYAVDRAVEILRNSGVTAGSVNAGGDIAFIGDKGGSPWRVAIQHPREAGGLLAVIPVRDRAVVTSGDYERYFEADGVRYHHLLNPLTGYPADACRSVTVQAPGAMLADGLATAAFVLGPEAGLKLLEEWPGVEGLIVSADGSVEVTSGLQGKVVWP